MRKPAHIAYLVNEPKDAATASSFRRARRPVACKGNGVYVMIYDQRIHAEGLSRGEAVSHIAKKNSPRLRNQTRYALTPRPTASGRASEAIARLAGDGSELSH